MSLAHGDWALAGVLMVLAAALAVIVAQRIEQRRWRTLMGGWEAMPPGRRRDDALLLVALALVLVALLGPRYGVRIERVPASGVDVVLLVDVSRSMDAADSPPSRIARARRAAEQVLAGLRDGDRAALAVFAGRGVLLTPLTPDRRALGAMVPALDSGLMAQQGSDLAAGVAAAAQALRVPSQRPRSILLLSDGEDPANRPQLGVGAAKAVRAPVHAVVFGGENGAPIPQRSGAALRDRRGNPAATRADAPRLAALAAETGGELHRADRFGRVEIAPLLATVRRGATHGPEGFVERTVPVVHIVPFAVGALLLLLIEASAPGRLLPGRRRRALAAAGAAALLLGTDGGSAPNLEGNRLAPREEPLPAALIELGVARAERGALEDAERAFFAAAARAGEPALAATAYFDLGVSALARGDLERARDAFFDALAVAPEDHQARANLEWTLRALRAQPPPAAGEPPEEPPSEEHEARPRPQPDDPAPEPDSVHDAAPGGEPGLSEEERQRWLEAVEDDPRRTLGAALREGEARRPRSMGPAW